MAEEGHPPPPAANPAAPVARPNPDITTGRNAASEFAAQLASNYELSRHENNPNWPLFHHELSVPAVFRMFQNIIKPLVYGNFRAMGAQDTINPQSTVLLNNIIDHVSFEALSSLYTVLFNKANRLANNTGTLFGNPPVSLGKTFPSYAVAVINNLGPVKFDSIPFRGTHVPYFTYTNLRNIRPQPFQAHIYARFLDACARARTIALAESSPLSTTSDPFWTFHCIADPDTDYTAEDSYQIFSPVKFNESDLALKAAVLFAESKLTIGPGPINYSATPFYNVPRFTDYSQYPAAVRAFPYFIKGQPAFYATHEQAQADASTAGSSTELASAETSRRRRLPDGTVTTENETELYRLIYYYFDHIVARSINGGYRRDQWTIEFNRAQ